MYYSLYYAKKVDVFSFVAETTKNKTLLKLNMYQE